MTTTAATASERPRLADGVDLVGVLPGSGFDSTQFLVRRGAQFVQVTELLFRTLEALDARRTYADIASRLTEATDWSVTPDQARSIVVQKLVPLGLVTTGEARARVSDGSVPVDNIPTALISLFAPVVAVPLLALVVIAHVWLYFGHGVVNGLLEVLYAPGLLLVVFGLIVLAGLVHEFGHASGLRHGGGRARSMGVGLVYPAFYTDVTQSYAMPRAARLRTDLGGIYFHLLFALGLIGLYQVTGFEALLLAVLLIDIEAIRQLLPFGRLDGYWVLADLTGIPDPLSQMSPFVRRALPQDRVQGPRLPQLRPWVSRIFAVYIALALPVIGIVIVFLLFRLPVLVGLLWDALRLQVAQLATAAAMSDSATIAIAVLQIALLCFELVATAFILWKLGTQAASGIAALGRRPGRPRLAAFGLAAALVGGLTFLWGPHVAGLTANAGDGVAYYDVGSRSHVDGSVVYEQNPPVGGDHAAVWQDCGFYDRPVPAERAVHSMEHGAVWITYRPDLPADDLAELRSLASGRGHMLVSELADNPTPIVASG